MSRSGRKKKRALFVVEILVLLIFIGGLFVYGQINAKLSKISTPTVENFDQEQVAVNISAPKLTGYTNVALFALDHRAKTESAGGENSDTIIIASINNDTKEVKLVSVYRDCLLDIGDDTYQKCNAAYSLGGPQKALSMLNTNLDLNLQDYVTVDFTAMVKAVDMLGGLDIPMTYQELVHMNNYCVETSEETETDYEPIPLPDPKPEDETAILDTYHLNGVQVTSYCRIRATASMDFGRTERQRMVIQMMVHKATKSSIATLSEIMDEVFPYVETSFSKSEIVKMALGMLSYRIDETTGFPQMIQMTDLPTKGSVVIPTTLESNVVELHKFLFSDDEYTPSDTVKSKSDTIVDLTGFGEGGEVVREGALSAVADALENEDSYGIQASPQDAASDENTTVTENTNIGTTDWNTETGTTDWNTETGTTDWSTGTGTTDWNSGTTDWSTGTGTTDWNTETGTTDWNTGTGTTNWNSGTTDWSTGTGTTNWNSGTTDWSTGTGTTDWSAGTTDSGYNTGFTDNFNTGY